MEKLIVENFLTIEKAELEVGRMTVIIGPQASGKSVLAKLVYFFRELLFNQFLSYGEDLEWVLGQSSDEPDIFYQKAQREFISLFEIDSLPKSEFNISYSVGEVWLQLQGWTGEYDSTEWKLIAAQKLTDLYQLLRTKYQEGIDAELNSTRRFTVGDTQDKAAEQLLEWGIKPGGTFIPASRSFFAHL